MNKMNKKICIAIAFLAMANATMMAQQKDSLAVKELDEVVISDTKIAQNKEKSGKIIIKITQSDLQQKSGQSLATILSAQAGIEINGNQSAGGKNLGTYIRGGRNRQVLVLIDGVAVSDASGINAEFDLRLLPVAQIESIEIMKGAASTLYGSGAATGVINITLKKGIENQFVANAYYDFGTNNTANDSKIKAETFNQGFSVSKNSKKLSFLTSFNNSEANGMSEAAGLDFENDSYSRINLSQKLGIKINSQLALDFFGNYDKINNDFDNSYSDTFSADNLKNKSQIEQFRFGFSPKLKYKKGLLFCNSSAVFIKRNLNVSDDSFLYQSKIANIDAVNKYQFSKKWFAVLGTQFQFSEMNFESAYGNIEKNAARFITVDPNISLVFNANSGFNLNIGARLNNHSVYGNQMVYNINPSYNLGAIKLISSFSTAYITPSLYQLHDPYSGNMDLKPESNSTFEIGFETHFLEKKINWNMVFFQREEKNAIDVDANYVYTNIEGKNNAIGAETALEIAVFKNLDLKLNYAFNDLDSPLRRLNPKHKINTQLDFRISKTLNLGCNYQYLSDRSDVFGYPNQNTILKAYQLFDTTFHIVCIKNKLNLFCTISNIFNENFVENIGYSTRGRNFKMGLNVSI